MRFDICTYNRVGGSVSNMSERMSAGPNQKFQARQTTISLKNCEIVTNQEEIGKSGSGRPREIVKLSSADELLTI